MQAQRLESMSPIGFLSLYRQADGDVIVTVGEGREGREGLKSVASVEFCTPGAGGGGSRKTWAALVQLMRAMAEDGSCQ